MSYWYPQHQQWEALPSTETQSEEVPRCRRKVQILGVQKEWEMATSLCYGEGNGSSLQYSCLENPTDGAWWATVHGVLKSRTWLRDFTFTFHFHALEKEMATHSSVLAWRIPGTGEPGGLPSMGSHRVRHDWSGLAAPAAAAASVRSNLDPHILTPSLKTFIHSVYIYGVFHFCLFLTFYFIL